MAANTQALAVSWKQDIFNGLHAFGTSVVRASTTADTFYGALYITNQGLGSSTTAYSATGEVSGSGYTAGGAAVTNATAPATSGATAYWTPSANLVWTAVTLATAFDTLLLYNNTATGKNAVGAFTFGATTVTAGNFTVSMPTNSSTTGLIRLT